MVPTKGKSGLLDATFEGLCSQSFKDFVVLLILKSTSVEISQIVKRFSRCLNIKIVLQKGNSLMEAYAEGTNIASGDIVAFLDDDAIPKSSWLSEHISSYEIADVSGVSGDVISAYMKNSVLDRVGGSSEIQQSFDESPFLSRIGAKFWYRPLEGQEDFLAYISKAGYSQKKINSIYRGKTNSLLCMASNMSVRRFALKDFCMPSSFTKRGIAFEQVIGWHLWKAGRRMVFNPKAKVCHIIHGQTMSRFLGKKVLSQAYAEDELLFYYLFFREEKLSIMHRIVSLTHRLLVHTKKLKDNLKAERTILNGIFFGNLLGVAWLISQKIQGSFIPIQNRFFRNHQE